MSTHQHAVMCTDSKNFAVRPKKPTREYAVRVRGEVAKKMIAYNAGHKPAGHNSGQKRPGKTDPNARLSENQSALDNTHDNTRVK